MTGLRIFNTLTNKLEYLTTEDKNEVKVYVCGITAYDLTHIGHARSIVIFDVIVRYLRHKGLKVKFVRNFTDVDDKIIKRAREEGEAASEIAQKYIQEFKKDTHQLGLIAPDFEPKVTENIQDIIKLIETLIEKGFAYESGGDVYFSVEKFKDYGKLSKRTREEMLAGARVEPSENKKNPLDFALWKSSKKDEPFWDSPWGKGRPGWHIECSLMAMKYLGETIDIHAGGQDLIFPHHENEIAQSEAASGKPFAKYWLHAGHLSMKGEKMSKSLGNVINLKDIYKDFLPETLRFFIVKHHYRSPVEFSIEALEEAERTLAKFYLTLEDLLDDRIKIEENDFSKKILSDFESSMDNDFNTPEAISKVFLYFEELKTERKTPEKIGGFVYSLKKISEVLGVFGDNSFTEKLISLRLEKAKKSREQIDSLVQERERLRKERRFKEADLIREELVKIGLYIQDKSCGSKIVPLTF